MSKTILTTNTTWAQTTAMAARLVGVLGTPLPEDPALRSFPAPDVVAANEAALIANVRLGYRSAYVLSLARSIASGALDLEALRVSLLPTPDLRRELLRLPGVGPYAAATLLMILQRYDELAIDTALRAHVRRKYRASSGVTLPPPSAANHASPRRKRRRQPPQRTLLGHSVTRPNTVSATRSSVPSLRNA